MTINTERGNNPQGQPKRQPRYLFHGFTPKELWETFDKIKDEQDWKNPILYTFPRSIVEDTSFSVIVAKCDATIIYYHSTKAIWYNNADGSVTLISKGCQLKRFQEAVAA